MPSPIGPSVRLIDKLNSGSRDHFLSTTSQRQLELDLHLYPSRYPICQRALYSLLCICSPVLPYPSVLHHLIYTPGLAL